MRGQDDLAIKTFTETRKEDMDQKINIFRKTHDVRFVTPCNVAVGATLVYSYVVYYVDKPTPVATEKECPKCKEKIPFGYDKHFKCGWDGSKA